MINQIIAPAKPRMESAVAHLVEEFKTLRTGRAAVQMLDSVVVPYYGVMTPLKQLATVTAPDPHQLVIQPYDAGVINDIRLGIEQADLGFRASDDGRVLRVTIPILTAERREELVKKASKMAEAARISLRNVRGDIWEEVQEIQKKGEISEDNRDWARAELDKMIAEFNKKVEELYKEKEQEIKTV